VQRMIKWMDALISSPFHRNIYLTGWPQCQVMYWIRYDNLAGNQGKVDALGNGSEQQITLHHGKVQADTDARACAERHECIARKPFLAFRCEAPRIKLLWVREVFLAAMQRVGREQDNPAFGDAVAVNLDIA
jgi:hypothetical protein